MLEINLLPVREERRKASQRQLLVMMGVTLLASVGVATIHYAKLRSDVGTAQAALKDTQAKIDQLKPQLEQVEHYKAVKASIEQKLDIIASLDRSRTGPVRVFDEIATHAPDRLWLTRFEHNGGVVKIEGLSLDNELVALFMTSLSDSDYFQGVELEETEATEVDGFRLNRFKVSATALMAGPTRVASNAGTGN